MLLIYYFYRKGRTISWAPIQVKPSPNTVHFHQTPNPIWRWQWIKKQTGESLRCCDRNGVVFSNSAYSRPDPSRARCLFIPSLSDSLSPFPWSSDSHSAFESPHQPTKPFATDSPFCFIVSRSPYTSKWFPRWSIDWLSNRLNVKTILTLWSKCSAYVSWLERFD